MSRQIISDSLNVVPAGRTLELTLKRQWFDMVASGEKKEEYREQSDWIMSRLKGKQYATVRFRNGYNADSPVCVCEYKGWRIGEGRPEWGYDGFPLVVIKLGRVLERPDMIATKAAAVERLPARSIAKPSQKRRALNEK